MSELAWRKTTELEVMEVKIGNTKHYKIVTKEPMKNMPKTMPLIFESSDGFISKNQHRFKWREPGVEAPDVPKKSRANTWQPGDSQPLIDASQFQRPVQLQQPKVNVDLTKPKKKKTSKKSTGPEPTSCLIDEIDTELPTLNDSAPWLDYTCHNDSLPDSTTQTDTPTPLDSFANLSQSTTPSNSAPLFDTLTPPDSEQDTSVDSPPTTTPIMSTATAQSSISINSHISDSVKSSSSAKNDSTVLGETIDQPDGRPLPSDSMKHEFFTQESTQ